ncbi:hypothetical protein V5J35_003376 [Endozoicomonas sp. NE40]|uniref:Uncharacterized protein n=1 Tax=Endozoicomonas lisbonensis TaxID=3120522 RepID=A0ABV2SK90_9GAMM
MMQKKGTICDLIPQPFATGRHDTLSNRGRNEFSICWYLVSITTMKKAGTEKHRQKMKYLFNHTHIEACSSFNSILLFAS